MKIQKERLKSPAWTAVISACIFGVLVHLFGLLNILHNHDDINNQPYGYGSGVTSGRWLLGYLGKFAQKMTGNYDMPLLNGVIFIAFLAVSAGIIIQIFKVKSRGLSCLMGMLIVTFPAVTCTLLFRYTAPYYGVAVLFAVLAVWVIQEYRYGFLASAILTALALGIYQAYLPITASIFVLLLIRQALEEDLSFWKVIKRGIYYCSSMIAGLVLYYVALQASLAYYNTTLSDYQGISDMGNLSIKEIPGLVLDTIKAFVILLRDDYCTLAQNKLLKLCYLFVYVAIAAIILITVIKKRKSFDLIIAIAMLCAVFPIAVNLIMIMCPNGDIRTIMVFSFVILLCAPLLLVEVIPSEDKIEKSIKQYLQKGVMLIALITVLAYAYLTQVNYTAQYYANRQAENYLNALVVQVRMTEGFDTEKEWAFIGYIKDPLFQNPWQYADIYGDNKNSTYLLNSYSRTSWIKNYFGYTVPMADDQKVEELQEREDVKNMPCWPNEGSIKVIDDTIVIKFQDK